MATTVSKPANETRPMTEEADFLQIKSVDHVHFYVGNAKHAMYYSWKAFGFKPVAYSGLETGNRDFASYVLESGQARFVVSAAYSSSSPLAAHHMVHGDGVKVIATVRFLSVYLSSEASGAPSWGGDSAFQVEIAPWIACKAREKPY